MTTWPPDPYDKAIAAEPGLQPIAYLVDVLTKIAPTRRSGKAMCHACLWECVIKPLTSPLLGHGRGYPPEQAPPWPRSSWQPIDLTLYLDGPDRRIPPDNGTETWLRTSEAWDAVTDRWLERLEAADPANGHGFGACQDEAS